uniref:Putative secreted protein n=1 Tax=Anopheles darlingi TaxID=43151 RepID=A0A2M4DLD0_ANODA
MPPALMLRKRCVFCAQAGLMLPLASLPSFLPPFLPFPGVREHRLSKTIIILKPPTHPDETLRDSEMCCMCTHFLRVEKVE